MAPVGACWRFVDGFLGGAIHGHARDRFCRQAFCWRDYRAIEGAAQADETQPRYASAAEVRDRLRVARHAATAYASYCLAECRTHASSAAHASGPRPEDEHESGCRRLS